jgi:hypothetical protein
MVTAGVKAFLFVAALVVSVVATEEDCGTQVEKSSDFATSCVVRVEK